jgi:DNA-directed RNA polymerase subunit H (RpoH/RPB5)
VAEAQKVEDSLQEDKSESSSVLVQPEVTEVPEDEARQVMEAFRAKESQLESASSKSAVKAESEFKGDPVVSSSAAQDFSVAPVGELIPSIPGPDDVEIPDLDHLTVKPMDGYLVEPKPEEKVDVPDTSHLKLDD